MINMTENIKNVFSYPGSKFCELDYIYNIINYDNYDTFIDCMGGSGVVSVNIKNKFNHLKVIYNDYDKNIYGMIDLIKDDNKKKKLLTFLDNTPVNEKTFYELKEKINESILNYFYIHIYSFRNTLTLFQLRKGVATKRKKNYNEKINIYNKMLKNIDIYNLDFRDIVEKYKNNEKAIIYFDPPYMSKNQRSNITNSESKYNTFTVTDYIKILDYLKDENIKCKIIINSDFNGFIHFNYSDYIIKSYPKKYRACHNSSKYCTRYQTFLTNKIK